MEMLKDKEFIVEIMDSKLQKQVENKIDKLGGKIVDYINEKKERPYMVVSDSPEAKRLQLMTKEQQISAAKSKKLPLLLQDAVENGVKIVFASQFLERLKPKNASRGQPVRPAARKSTEELFSFRQERKRMPFSVRIEDECREFAPLKKEVEPPVMYIGKDYGTSLFHKSDEATRSKRRDELKQEKDGNLNYVNVDSQTAGANNNKLPNKQSGNCEICNRRVSNLKEHYDSKEHLKYTSAPGFYDEVDQFMGSYVPHIKVPGKPVLLRRPRTPSPILEFEDYIYGEPDFGRLSDDEKE